MKIMHKKKKNSAFKKLLKKCEEGSKGDVLSSLLLTPIIRFAKYQWLLEVLLCIFVILSLFLTNSISMLQVDAASNSCRPH
jgi:hypothetical protein